MERFRSFKKLLDHKNENPYTRKIIPQNIINNALKYAEVSEILISARLKNEGLSINITDNGKGFDLENYQPGNGIKNMIERAKLINSALDLSSSKDGGTTIQFSVNSDSYSK